MNPGPELDKVVCEIVGIPPGRMTVSGTQGEIVFCHKVSTCLGSCEPVIEWLYQNTIDLQYNFSEDRFVCDDYELPCGETLQHAACLAVVAINEERKKG